MFYTNSGRWPTCPDTTQWPRLTRLTIGESGITQNCFISRTYSICNKEKHTLTCNMMGFLSLFLINPRIVLLVLCFFSSFRVIDDLELEIFAMITILRLPPRPSVLHRGSGGIKPWGRGLGSPVTSHSKLHDDPAENISCCRTPLLHSACPVQISV